MKRLSKVLLVTVLLCLLAVPASAGNATYQYESIYLSDGQIYLDMYAYSDPWSGSAQWISIFTGDFYCQAEDPAGADVFKLISIQGGTDKVAFDLPSTECDYWSGTLPETISVDLMLTAEMVYHGSSHENIVKGVGENRNCQYWSMYEMTAEGTVAGMPIGELVWGDGYSSECKYTGK